MANKQDGFSEFFIVVTILMMIACAGINYPTYKSPLNDHITGEYSFEDKTCLKDMFEKPIFMVDPDVVFSTSNNKIVKIVPHNGNWQIIND
jgi:hypothetical protein